jgi:hypothetical protein
MGETEGSRSGSEVGLARQAEQAAWEREREREKERERV